MQETETKESTRACWNTCEDGKLPYKDSITNLTIMTDISLNPPRCVLGYLNDDNNNRWSFFDAMIYFLESGQINQGNVVILDNATFIVLMPYYWC